MTGALLACAALLLLSFGYIFWPQRRTLPEREMTRLDYLRERRDVIYSNLRDLSFENKAGKYPQADYEQQRAALEREAASVLTEMDSLAAGTTSRGR